MLENELEIIWKNSTKAEVVKIDKPEFLTDIDLQLKYFDKNIKKRDRREYIAAAIVTLTFGTGFFFFTGILSKLGLLLGALYGILVIIVLQNAKKQKPDNYSLPIKEYLVQHRKYLVKERNLLKNVIYWYILPPFIGSVLFCIGQYTGVIQFIISITIVSGINVYIYFLNKAAVRKVFDPLIKKIDKTIEDLETIE